MHGVPSPSLSRRASEFTYIVWKQVRVTGILSTKQITQHQRLSTLQCIISSIIGDVIYGDVIMAFVSELPDNVDILLYLTMKLRAKDI